MTFDDARARAAVLDAADALAPMRDRFDIPDGTLYFDGNSLGPLTRASREMLTRTIEHEWRVRLIRSWNEDWLEMPARVGDAIARLIGASPGTTIACDNTSINLHKALSAAVRLRPGRSEIVVDADNFPTDIYIAASIAEQHGLRLVAVPADRIMDTITERTAVVTATHVDYRSARILDFAGITAAAHAHGAFMVWDLAHSAGAIEVDLEGHDVDFAVGCGYKYLNGGPGAPAFVYAAPRLLAEAGQPLQGWWGHAEPFAFEVDYRPAPGVGRFLTGTANVVSLKSLEAALTAFEGVSMVDIRSKSVSLTSLLVDMWETHLAPKGFTLGSPHDAEQRGSHVALGFSGGRNLINALAARDVVADFRPPDLMRFGLAPLYNRHMDVVALVENLAESVRGH
jgi:kynureninase